MAVRANCDCPECSTTRGASGYHASIILLYITYCLSSSAPTADYLLMTSNGQCSCCILLAIHMDHCEYYQCHLYLALEMPAFHNVGCRRWCSQQPAAQLLDNHVAYLANNSYIGCVHSCFGSSMEQCLSSWEHTALPRKCFAGTHCEQTFPSGSAHPSSLLKVVSSDFLALQS